MKKMKKKAVAILLVMMMVFTVTGCSQAELGYMNLSKEMLQMNAVTIDEHVVIELSGHKLDALTGLELGERLEIKATGAMNMQSGAFDLELSYKLANDEKFSSLTRMAMNGETMYMSAQGIWNLVKTYSGQEFSPEYIAEVDAYLASHPFVKVDATTEGIDMDAYYANSMKQSIDILDIMTKYHSGFDSNTVTEKDGGYQIYVDSEGLIKLVDNWLGYMQNDTANSYGMAKDIIAVLAQSMQELGVSAEELQLSQEEWQQSLAMLSTIWSELKAALADSPLSDQDYYEAFCKMTGTAGNREITSNSKINIEELGMVITTTASSQESKAQVSPAFNATDAEIFAADLQAITDRYTVFVASEITPAEDGVAWANINMTFCGNATTGLNYADVQYIGDKYHICLQELDHVLPGAEVVLEDGKATVSFNGQSAVLDTTMAACSTGETEAFIAIRDLSQLGLVVEYQANPEVLVLSVQ